MDEIVAPTETETLPENPGEAAEEAVSVETPLEEGKTPPIETSGLSQVEEPTPEPQAVPLTHEQLLIQKLSGDLDGMRTLLGTLLWRANGTLIVLNKHRRGYFEQIRKFDGRAPTLNVENFGKGDLRITAIWDPAEFAALAAAAEEAGPPIEEIAAALDAIGEEIAPIAPAMPNWTFEEKIEVLNYCNAIAAQRAGVVTSEIPQRPAVLVPRPTETAPE